jgi:hypothetical protein
MKNKTSLIKKILSAFLVVLIGVPPAQADGGLSPTSILNNKDPLDFGSNASGPIWNYLPEKLYEGETDPKQLAEKERLSKLLFAEYLGYLNAVGIELASFENSIQGKKEIQQSGECSDDTLKSYNKILADSAGSDLATFTNAYCNSPCRQKAEFDFAQIAHFAEPENGVKSCEETAKEMYNSYNCDEFGTNRDDRNSIDTSMADMADLQMPSVGDFGTSSDLNFGSDFSGASVGTDAPLNLGSRGIPGTVGRSAIIGGSSKLPKLGITIPSGSDLKSSKTAADGDFKSLLSKKKIACKKANSDRMRQTFAPTDGTSKATIGSSIRDPLDPRWTNVSGDLPDTKKDLLNNTEKNPACKLTESEQFDHFSKLRSGYMRISLDKIFDTLQVWPIFDDNDHVQKEYLRLITSTADQLFLPLIDELEANYREVCNGGGGSSSVSAVSQGTTEIGGTKLKVIAHGGPEETDLNKDQDKKTAELATVATYFNSNSSIAESFVNGLFGATEIGSDSPFEFRAGEIAKGVQDGTIKPGDVSKEAAKGVTNPQAAEIERITRRYLSQGDYQGLKVAAAQIAGGITSGALVGAGVKGSAILAEKGIALAKGTLGGGKLSTLLTSVQKTVMIPMMEGGQTGAVSFGPFFKTTKEATAAANELGFSKVAGTVNGQAIYSNGKTFISRDIDGHNGGVWKMAKTIRDLGQRSTRMGTYDKFLNWIGD